VRARTYDVDVPVQAAVGPILGFVAPAEEVLIGGWTEPDYEHRPWAVLARCTATFHFGRRVRSKTLKARRRFDDEPSVRQVMAAYRECVAEITGLLSEHGITIDADHPNDLDLTDAQLRCILEAQGDHGTEASR